jgi:AraC-like DNA-binding protein
LLAAFPKRKVTAVFARKSLPEVSNDGALWELVSAISYVADEKPPDASLIMGNAKLILERLLNKHSVPPPVFNSKQKFTSGQQAKFHGYIEAHLADDFGPTELAGTLSLSVSHVSMLCHNTHGKSPMKYVLECRLGKAHAMAFGGEHLAYDIAKACGFCGTSHLNRAFKKRYKHTVGVLLRRKRS